MAHYRHTLAAQNEAGVRATREEHAKAILPEGYEFVDGRLYIAGRPVNWADGPYNKEPEHGGTMRVHFDGDNYQDCIDQMQEAVAEWEGNSEAPTAPPAGAPGTEKPRRGRKPKLQALANPVTPITQPAGSPGPANTENKTWNVCQFHVQAVNKVGKPSNIVAPHECEGCRVMAQGQSFETLLGLGGGAAPGISAAGAVHSPAATTSTGVTVENVKAVMRELVQSKIKAAGAKTDAEIQAAAKPIGDWLAANFKNAEGKPCEMASEIQPADYHRFNAEALKMAEASAPKKSMFD